jgi:membrane associated rhomboid family serine protease
VTLTLTFASAAALVLARITGGYSNAMFFSIYRPSHMDALLFVRLFGHALGHADAGHYVGNFILVLLLGPMLEEKYGSKRLALCVAGTALVCGMFFLLFSAPNTALLGASGIVFMLMLLASFSNVKKGRIPLTVLLALAVFIGREVISGIAATDNVSYASHVLGGVCGAVYGFIIHRKQIKTSPAR